MKSKKSSAKYPSMTSLAAPRPSRSPPNSARCQDRPELFQYRVVALRWVVFVYDRRVLGGQPHFQDREVSLSVGAEKLHGVA
ncbi:hypothetical protein FF1_043686 [Malus domestica]